MSDEKTKPFLFVQPDDPIVAQYANVFEMMAAPENHTLNMDVPPDVVEGQEVAMLQEMMMALQHDHEARLYTLIGDIMADGRTSNEPANNPNHGYVGVEGEEAEIMCQRLHTACWMLLMFCHNCDYDPKPTIEAILADFDLPVTYKMVYDKYKEDSDKGIFFRVRKTDGGPNEAD